MSGFWPFEALGMCRCGSWQWGFRWQWRLRGLWQWGLWGWKGRCRGFDDVQHAPLLCGGKILHINMEYTNTNCTTSF